MAAHLQRVFGQPFVLDHRVGAGSTLGGGFVARAAPDGHTLLLGSTSTYVIAPFVYRPPPYDPVAGFAPVAMLTEAATALVTHPRSGLGNLDALLAAARARPGQVTYASAGNGSLPHVFGALFAALAGVQLTHIPYRGGAPALNDVIAGQVDLMFEVVSTVGPQIEDGRLVPLLSTGATRPPNLAEVPTAAEAGLPDLNLTSWIGLAAPARTPPAIIDALNREVNVALRSESRRGLRGAGRQRRAGRPGRGDGGTHRAAGAILPAHHRQQRDFSAVAGGGRAARRYRLHCTAANRAGD